MGVIFDVAKNNEEENPKRNASGCLDLTAHEAIRRACLEMEHSRLHKMLNILHTVCELNDFHIEERIVLKDKKTGRIWR